jgi:hypothetical protein
MTVSLVRAGTTGDSDGSYHQILSAEQEPQVGLTFGVWRMAPGTGATLVSRDSETAALVFSGSGNPRRERPGCLRAARLARDRAYRIPLLRRRFH